MKQNILILIVISSLASICGYQIGRQKSESNVAAESFLMGVRVSAQLVQANPTLRYPEIERASLKYVLALAKDRNIPRGQPESQKETPAPTRTPAGSMHVTQSIMHPIPPHELEAVLNSVDK